MYTQLFGTSVFQVQREMREEEISWPDQRGTMISVSSVMKSQICLSQSQPHLPQTKKMVTSLFCFVFQNKGGEMWEKITSKHKNIIVIKH